MSGFEETPPQAWKLDEAATTPEDDAAHLAEKIEEYVVASAKYDSYMTPEQRTEEVALKAFQFGLTVPQLEDMIAARKVERRGKLDQPGETAPESEG